MVQPSKIFLWGEYRIFTAVTRLVFTLPFISNIAHSVVACSHALIVMLTSSCGLDRNIIMLSSSCEFYRHIVMLSSSCEFYRHIVMLASSCELDRHIVVLVSWTQTHRIQLHHHAIVSSTYKSSCGFDMISSSCDSVVSHVVRSACISPRTLFNTARTHAL
jgi:hypothetical protein